MHSVGPSSGDVALVVHRKSDVRDFFDVIRSRRSVRAYRDADVSEDDLARVLDAMNHAPSAGDLQAYEVVVVRSPERRGRLARAAYHQAFVAAAPVVLVFFMHRARSRAKYGERGARLYACQDATIAATIAAAHAQLAAHALGLATVWVGAFDDEAVRQAVDAPVGLHPSSLLVVGHPAELPEPTPRRPLADLVRRETFG
jgi:nitroreductase